MRLIAVNVDAALAASTHALSGASVDAVAAVRRSGTEIVLVSALGARMLRGILRQLRLFEPAQFIAAQGALTGALAPDGVLRVVHESAMPLAAAHELVATADAVGLTTSWFRGFDWFVPRVDEWNTSWDLGVHVTWTLWDGGRARAERGATLAEADALGHRLTEFDAALAVEIRQRLRARESALAAVAACAEGVTAATDNQRVVGERFAVGLADSTDVLDAEGALSEAELECTRLTAGVRLAEAALLRAVAP